MRNILASILLLCFAAVGLSQGVKVTPWTSTTSSNQALAALGGAAATNFTTITLIYNNGSGNVTNKLVLVGTNRFLANLSGPIFQGRGYIDELQSGWDPAEMGFITSHNVARGDNSGNNILVESMNGTNFLVNPFVWATTDVSANIAQLIISTSQFDTNTPATEIKFVAMTNSNYTCWSITRAGQELLALNINGSLRFGGRLAIGGSAPSIAADLGAGTGATVSVDGSDLAGEITVNTGTSPLTSATIATVTYSTTFLTKSYVTIWPANDASANRFYQWPWTRGNAANFDVFGGSPALSQNTTYKWIYHVIGN